MCCLSAEVLQNNEEMCFNCESKIARLRYNTCIASNGCFIQQNRVFLTIVCVCSAEDGPLGDNTDRRSTMSFG